MENVNLIMFQDIEKNKNILNKLLKRRKLLKSKIDEYSQKSGDLAAQLKREAEHKLESVEDSIFEIMIEINSSFSDFQKKEHTENNKIDDKIDDKISIAIENKLLEISDSNKKQQLLENKKEDKEKKVIKKDNKEKKVIKKDDKENEVTKKEDKEKKEELTQLLDKILEKKSTRIKAKKASDELTGFFDIKSRFKRTYNKKLYKFVPLKTRASIDAHNEALYDELEYWKNKELKYKNKFAVFALRGSREAEIKNAQDQIKKIEKLLDINKERMIKLETGIFSRLKDAAYRTTGAETKDDQVSRKQYKDLVKKYKKPNEQVDFFGPEKKLYNHLKGMLLHGLDNNNEDIIESVIRSFPTFVKDQDVKSYSSNKFTKNASSDEKQKINMKFLDQKSSYKGLINVTNSKEALDKVLKLNINKDVLTDSKIIETNKKIYEYLIESGEIDIANYIYELMKPKEDIKSVENKSDDIKELSLINSKILEKLDEIEKNMIDEQDTSVSIPQKLQAQVKKDEVKKESTDAWFYKMLQKFFGSGLMAVIGALKSFGELAIAIAGSAWVFLKTKIGTLFGELISKALMPIKEALSKFSGLISGIIKKVPLLGTVGSAVGAAGKAIGIKKAGAPDLNAEKNNIKTTSNKTKPVKTGKLANLTKSLKLIKGIPGVGTIAALGFAGYDAVSGYNNAGENLGIEDKDLTFLNKSSSAAGSMISGFTLGLIDEKNASAGINNFFDGNKIINKYEKLGIIQHHSANWYGTNKESEILDWNKLQNLAPKEIKEIIRIDDWSDADLSKMYTILKSKIGDMTDEDLKLEIKKNEGLSLMPYKDADGYSVGYGHFIKPNEKYLMNGVTKEQADILFEEDFESHKKAAMTMPGFSEHPKEIQNVLVDMTYNMGPGWWKKWKETPEALKNKNYKKAAELLSKSAYARQTKGRAQKNIDTLMAYGSYNKKTDEYNKSAKSEVTKVPKMVKTEEVYKNTINNVKNVNYTQEKNISNLSNININNTEKQNQSAFDMMATA